MERKDEKKVGREGEGDRSLELAEGALLRCVSVRHDCLARDRTLEGKKKELAGPLRL